MTWTLTTSNALNTSSRALYGRSLPNAGGEYKQRNALRAKTGGSTLRFLRRSHGRALQLHTQNSVPFLVITLSELRVFSGIQSL